MVLWAGWILTSGSKKLSHQWPPIQHQALCLAKVLHFPTPGFFLNYTPLFAHKIEKAAVSNRQFLNLLAVSEIKFQPIICSRHSSVFQLYGLFCSFLRTAEIADGVTLISCSIELLVLPELPVSHSHQWPPASHSDEADSVKSAWAHHLLRLNHVWGPDWHGKWSKADLLITSSLPVLQHHSGSGLLPVNMELKQWSFCRS